MDPECRLLRSLRDCRLRSGRVKRPCIGGRQIRQSITEPELCFHCRTSALCSPQNQRATCEATNCSFSNTPHCFPPKKIVACAPEFFITCISLGGMHCQEAVRRKMLLGTTIC